MNTVVPTSATIKAAKNLIALTPERGAEAALNTLAATPPEQVAALVALLARRASDTVAPPRERELHALPRGIDLTQRAPVGAPLVLSERRRIECHRRFRGGDRSPGVVYGEREYQKARKRAQAAARRDMRSRPTKEVG